MQMNAANELLVAALEEQRPVVLVLGQNSWVGSEGRDPILEKAFDKLGRSNAQLERGWPALLDSNPVPSSFYEWLAERFERRVHPPWLSVLRELPWSAVFTSTLDPTLKTLLSGPGREAEVVLTASETPRAVRSRARPPLYYLFGRAGSLGDALTCPPLDRGELNSRRIGHALPLLGRVLDTATTLGLVVVDGFVAGRDWLRIEDILGAVGRAAPRRVLWFGGRPELAPDDAADFEAALASERIIVTAERLGTVVAQLRALDQIVDLGRPESEEAGIVTFKGGQLETTPEERLRVEAVASIVDDSWTSFLAPLGSDAAYEKFRRFHGGLGGAHLLVEGVRRGFAIERDFESDLLRQVTLAVADHASADAPIIIHGQSGTGKSVALARVVSQFREKKAIPVLYAIGRVPQSQEVSSFCEAAQKAGAEATLIVSDANRDVDSYRELLMSLRSRGQRVVVLGSRYRFAEGGDTQSPLSIEAATKLSVNEQKSIAGLITRYLAEQPGPYTFVDVHILALLYRFIPPSRSQIAAGLGAEAIAAEQVLRTHGQKRKVLLPDTQLAQKLIEAGFDSDYRPLFDEQQCDVLEAGDTAGRIIDLVMVAGKLNCPVPVNLLLRAVTTALPGLNLALIGELFGELDLFRWKWADGEQNELLVLPRLTLEAELICRRRLGDPDREAERLMELIRAVGSSGIDSKHERRFLFGLLQQVGPDGPFGPRYKNAYVAVARTLTELRERYGLVHPRLVLQESAFRRIAVRETVVDDDERLPLLEEARDAVQSALDSIASGTISAPRRTRNNLRVERAAIYGFLANDRANHDAPAAEIWSSYEAARVAIRHAVSVTDSYFPLDVGLWTPVDLLTIADLTKTQRAELAADIYATLDQVDPTRLPPKQREHFDRRRLSVGQALQDQELTEEAYTSLALSGSTAGYFLRARELGPDLTQDLIAASSPGNIACAKRAADFLNEHFDKIEQDERCLSLLLENRWIAETGQRPFRGQRQPLPADSVPRRDILAILRTLNQAAGENVRHVTRYLEAVLTWLTDAPKTAQMIFREISRETDYEDPSRVFRRHLITNADLVPRTFEGRIERQRSEGRWVIRVEGIDRSIDLLSRDFPHDEVAYGRFVKGFAIAFNFIGPIADPIKSRR